MCNMAESLKELASEMDEAYPLIMHLWFWLVLAMIPILYIISKGKWDDDGTILTWGLVGALGFGWMVTGFWLLAKL